MILEEGLQFKACLKVYFSIDQDMLQFHFNEFRGTFQAVTKVLCLL
jgi:hypothetical protein